MDHMLQNLRVAARTLLRHRAFTVASVLTLSLGIGATTAIFSVVYGVLLRPLPYPNADRLVAIGQTQRSNPIEPVSGSVSHVNFLDWRRTSKTIAPMALFTGSRLVVTGLGDADVVTGAIVTPDFFDVFRSAPVMGRAFTQDEDRPGGPDAIIVSYGFWQQRLGGRADVLTETVEVSGRPRPIVGVAPPRFEFPRGAQLWMPVKNNDEQCGRGCVFLNGIGRLSEDATPETAQQEMASIAARLEREFADNTDVTVMVQTLQDRTVGSVRLALAVLLAAVAMVLLIACANVANLVMVRGAARQSEIAVRSALGAGRRGVVSYLLTENLLLAFAGGTLGLALAWWGVDALRLLAPTDLPRLDDIRFDLPTFVFAAAMVVLTTMLFGLGPSFRLSRVQLSHALGSRGAIGRARQRRTRSALLVAEVGLSLVLLLGAGLLMRTLSALQQTDLGFETTGRAIFAISLPAARYPGDQVVPFYERLDEELTALPGVARVGRISELPLGPGENVQSFRRPDRPAPAPGQESSAIISSVDPDYFETMGIRVLAGRPFTSADRSDAPGAVIISRRMADVFWPGEDPIGRPIQLSRQGPAIVVGVVADVRSMALALPPQPEMFVPQAQSGARLMNYVVQSALNPAEFLASARRVVQNLDSRLPLISPGAMDDLVARQLGRPQFYVVLLSLFAALAIVLAAVGIYGVVAYAVTERTREIGVRMALGAQRPEVVRLMLWQGLRPAIVGSGLGLLVALAAGQVMRGLLYGVRPNDPMTFALVTLALLAVVVIASVIPAHRASGIAPAEALRGE